MERKGFGIRLVAALIDGVIFVLIAVVAGLIFGGTVSVSAGAQNQAGAVAAGRTGAIIGALLGLGYGALEIFKAQSVGKMVLKLKIADRSGAPAPVNQLVTRYLAKYSSSILGLLALITGIGVIGWLQWLTGLAVLVGCFLVLGDAKQALHDMIAKTAVFGQSTQPVGFQPIMPGANPPPPGA